MSDSNEKGLISKTIDRLIQYLHFFFKANKKSIIGVSIAVGFLASIAEFTGYNLKDLFLKHDEETKSFSLTVFVHGKNGKNDLILTDFGDVEITYGTKKARENINNKGQAIFNEIPKKYFLEGMKVHINIRETKGEPYSSIKPDSLYQLIPHYPIYLEVELQGLERVFGTVIYKDQPLDNVIVNIENLRDTTNELGSFEILIPEKFQKKEQEVRFFRKGFKLLTKKAFPQTQAPLNVVMSK